MKQFFKKEAIKLSLAICCFILLLTILILVSTFGHINQMRYSLNANKVFWLSLYLLVILIFYTFITWLKIGRDPIHVPVARYKPPEDVSPAFAYYLYNEMVDPKLLQCIISDLVMKDCIEIRHKGKGPSAKIYLVRKKKYQWEMPKDFPQEEQILLEGLLDYVGPCPLDTSIADRLESVRDRIENRFIIRRNQYIVGNEIYTIFAILITWALGVMPALFSANIVTSVLINTCFVIFFIICTGIVHDPRKKVIAGIVNTLIFIAGTYIDTAIHYQGFSPTQLLFLIGIWITVFYISLIRNVTPLGKKTFEQLNDFKEYIKTAEINRIAASNLKDKERIFCEYLPYAFAMDLSNHWLQIYTGVLSQAIENRRISYIDNVDIVSYQLKKIFQVFDYIH